MENIKPQGASIRSKTAALGMSQGMVAPSATGVGFRQLYPYIGCHVSPMEASCREVWVTEISSQLQNDMASWLLAALILHQTWHVEPCMISSKKEHMKPYEGKHATSHKQRDTAPWGIALPTA